VIAHVLFPAYATLQDDRGKLREAMLGTLHYVSLVTIPIGLGLALVARLFVVLAFGSEWESAGPIMAALSLYGTLLAVSWNIGDIYKAIDRLDILWKTALIELALLVPVLYVLAHQSALAVAMGHVVVAFMISSLRVGIAIRLLQLSAKQTFMQFVPAVIGGAIMSIVVMGTLQLTQNFLPVISLVLAVISGAISYVVALWWLERQLLRQLITITRSRIALRKRAIKSTD
jgi:O-antigen/teichoic acid export membrane protein